MVDVGREGEEIFASFTFGGQPAISMPVGIKLMKPRLVPVKVWVISKQVGSSLVKNPIYAPEKEELDNYLNNIFHGQINVQFDCSIESVPAIPFESENGEDFGGPEGSVWDSGYNVLDMHPGYGGEFLGVSSNIDPSASVNVYLVGGVGGGQEVAWNPESGRVEVMKDENGEPFSFGGITDVPGRRSWIIGGSDDGQTPGITAETIRDAIGHEIGHVIVGSGHPDTGSGIAPLPHTPVSERLMCSGGKRRTDGTSRILVKAEWDQALIWLRNEENEGRITE